jgi:serine/threonine protein kinase
MSAADVFRPGERVGRYTIERCLGRGGMGEVHLARTTEGEERAIKVLSSRARLQADVATRFTREVQLLSYLEHVHVVRFYEAGQAERSGRQMLWVALEHLQGRTLRELLVEQGPFDPDRIIRFGRQIAQGVHEAHKIRVIHRDLKPENVIVTAGEIAKVIDFGIAKFKDWGAKQTQGSTAGTLLYMAPEQLDEQAGVPVGAATDVYALGLILRELATGRSPFVGPGGDEELGGVLLRKLTTDLPPLCAERPAFPAELGEIVDRACRREATARFADMQQLSDALAAVYRRRMDERRAEMLGVADSSLAAPVVELGPGDLGRLASPAAAVPAATSPAPPQASSPLPPQAVPATVEPAAAAPLPHAAPLADGWPPAQAQPNTPQAPTAQQNDSWVRFAAVRSLPGEAPAPAGRVRTGTRYGMALAGAALGIAVAAAAYLIAISPLLGSAGSAGSASPTARAPRSGSPGATASAAAPDAPTAAQGATAPTGPPTAAPSTPSPLPSLAAATTASTGPAAPRPAPSGAPPQATVTPPKLPPAAKPPPPKRPSIFDKMQP